MFKTLRSQAKAGASAKLSRLGRFAKGGKVNDHDADDKPVAKAKKAAGSVMVDGKPARGRLDRPGRNMARKGYADRGAVEPEDKSPPNPGEKSDVEQGKYLRNKAINDRVDAGLSGLTSAIGLGSAVAPIGRAKAFRTFMGTAGALKAEEAKRKWNDANKASEEAEAFKGKKRGGRT